MKELCFDIKQLASFPERVRKLKHDSKPLGPISGAQANSSLQTGSPKSDDAVPQNQMLKICWGLEMLEHATKRRVNAQNVLCEIVFGRCLIIR